IFAGGKMEGEVGRGEEGVAPVLRVAPGVGRAAVDDDREIAAARPGPGERPVGQCRRLVSESGALALRRAGPQRSRGGRTALLVAVDYDLIAEASGERALLDGLQRREHHGEAAFHVGDSGSV